MRFKDKVALITACASGIGRATAEIMASEGAFIVAVDNDQRRLDMTVEELNMTGGRAVGHCIDALNEQEVDAVVEETAKNYGIDILVNAVGGSTIIARPAATVDELSLDDWQRVIAFNLQGTFLFCHAVVPVMKQQKSGKIVNLASIAGRGLSQVVVQRLQRGERRHHRVHPQTVVRTRAVRHQRQRHRAQPDADRTHPPALEPAPAGRAGGRDRAHAAAARRRSGGPGEGDLLPRLVRRRFRHRPDDRRDRRV